MELVPIHARPVGVESHSVDARQLHAILNVGRDFSTWMRSRIDSLEFVEGTDFAVIVHSPDPGNGLPMGRIDYALTLDAAKHVALVERTEVGRKVRAYFIEAEKKLRTVAADPVALLGDPNVLRQLLGNYAERVQALEATVAEQAPKVATFDRIIATGDTLGFRCAAKLVREATGANETEFRTFLMSRARWVQRLDGTLLPTHVGTERGYVTVRDREWDDRDGQHHCKPELRVTQKGVAKAIEMLMPEGVS